MQPAAGAQGELTGLLMIRAYLESQGNARKKVLIPDSAHGTNPASVVIAGYEVQNIKSNDRGQIDTDHLREFVTDDVAALMVTNPSTLGIFEERIAEIAAILHERGALLYMDGANMNALAGVTRPGRFWRGRDAPEPAQDIFDAARRRRSRRWTGDGEENSRAVSADARSLFRNRMAATRSIRNRPQSIGRVRAFGGNFGVLLRALAYTLAYGPGIRQATEDAVLNANYIRKNLEKYFDLPYDLPSMHEVVFSDARQKKQWREHHGHRQALDRLRLSPLHHGVSADRSGRDDDRAHRIGISRRMRFVHRCHAFDRRRSRIQSRNRENRAALHARRPPGRNRGGAQARPALETGVAYGQDSGFKLKLRNGQPHGGLR